MTKYDQPKTIKVKVRLFANVSVSQDGKYCWRCDYWDWYACNLFHEKLEPYDGNGYVRCHGCMEAEKESKQGELFR